MEIEREEVVERIKETNEKSKTINMIINKLLHETEQSRIENWYRGKFQDKFVFAYTNV